MYSKLRAQYSGPEDSSGPAVSCHTCHAIARSVTELRPAPAAQCRTGAAATCAHSNSTRARAARGVTAQPIERVTQEPAPRDPQEPAPRDAQPAPRERPHMLIRVRPARVRPASRARVRALCGTRAQRKAARLVQPDAADGPRHRVGGPVIVKLRRQYQHRGRSIPRPAGCRPAYRKRPSPAMASCSMRRNLPPPLPPPRDLAVTQC